MTLIECIKSSLQSMRNNKMRSVLTLLGVVIGVASVIGLLSLGEGAKRDVIKEIQGAGSNVIIIQPNWAGNEQVRAGKRNYYYDRDVRSILRACPDVASISPQNVTTGTARSGSKTERATIRGVAANFSDIMGIRLRNGRFLSALDVSEHRRVAIVGAGIAERLFGRTNPIGHDVKLFGVRFTIIGILETRETTQFSPDGNAEDRYIYVPVTTLARFLHVKRYPMLFAKSASPEKAKRAVDEIRWYLDRLDGEGVHTVRSQEDLLKMVSTVIAIFTAVLGGIGSISLIVGGIGIMNIMLVSVTERTREIGTRKALGAKKRDIMLQFLIESVTLCLLGGLIGILVGWGVAATISRVSPVTARISTLSIILSFASAVITGLASGLYPAWRAAALDPIEALRYE